MSAQKILGYGDTGEVWLIEKELVDGAATTLFTLNVPNDTVVGGKFDIMVIATDGTNYTGRIDNVNFTVLQVASTFSTGMASDGHSLAVNSGGSTLTLAYAFDLATDNVGILLTPTSSLTTTSLKARLTVRNLSPVKLVP